MRKALRLRGGQHRSCINMALMVSLGQPCGRDGERRHLPAAPTAGPALRISLSTWSLCGGDAQGGLVCPKGAGLAHSRGGWGKPHGQFPGQDLSNAAATGSSAIWPAARAAARTARSPGAVWVTHPNVCSDLGQTGRELKALGHVRVCIHVCAYTCAHTCTELEGSGRVRRKAMTVVTLSSGRRKTRNIIQR